LREIFCFEGSPVTNAKRFDNYINGEWVAASDYATNINPSELSDAIGDYAKADLAQVNAAIDAARAAFPAWSTSGIQARHDSLDKVGTKSSPVAKNSAPCWPGKRARPCPKPSAK
jgi:hypothetical protein